MPKQRLVSAVCSFGLLLAFSTPGVGQQGENPIVTFIASKVKDPNAAFALIIQFKVKTGKEQAFETLAERLARQTRKEPGVTAYYAHRDSEPGVYVMYEQYKNIAAIRYHVNQPYFLAMAKDAPAIVDSQETRVVLVLDDSLPGSP